jgi:hypothetical protein
VEPASGVELGDGDGEGEGEGEGEGVADGVTVSVGVGVKVRAGVGVMVAEAVATDASVGVALAAGLGVELATALATLVTRAVGADPELTADAGAGSGVGLGLALAVALGAGAMLGTTAAVGVADAAGPGMEDAGVPVTGVPTIGVGAVVVVAVAVASPVTVERGEAMTVGSVVPFARAMLTLPPVSSICASTSRQTARHSSLETAGLKPRSTSRYREAPHPDICFASRYAAAAEPAETGSGRLWMARADRRPRQKHHSLHAASTTSPSFHGRTST